MIIGHKSNSETAGKSAHRPGGIHFHYLLTGNDHAKDNFVLALVETTDDYFTPRHHHNFEQIRLMLKGEFEYERGHIQKEMSVGYFGEGTYYRQKGRGQSVALFLQVGGPSGAGFMSHRRLRAGAEELEKTGTFERGVYKWLDAEGKRHHKDGYEAVWEHVMGTPVEYPEPRFERPVIMFPRNFEYLPVRGVPGAEVKELGRFNERRLTVRQLRLAAGSSYPVDGAHQSFLFYVMSGSGTANGEPWQTESALQCEMGERVTLQADDASEFFVIGLPVFDD